MRVLFFAPAPSLRNPNMAPFILQRIRELQKKGVYVEVLQFGNLRRRKLSFSGRRGIARIVENALIVPLHLLKKLFFPTFAFGMQYSRNGTSYIYYNQIDYESPEDFLAWFRKKKFDLIHAHFLWYAKPLPELKERFGIPYAVTVHGSDVHDTLRACESVKKQYASIMNAADAVTFVSGYLKHACEQFGYCGKNGSVIYNGFDPAIFFPRRLEPHGDKPVLGFVGHTIHVKRVDILADVLFLVQKRFPHARLCIVGFAENPADDLVPQLKKRAAELGVENAITFAGKVLPENIPDYMNTFDVLLFPSRMEGLGCVALEAQACGVGVVGSANGGIPEAIGKNGTVVPESEHFTEDFSAAVTDYLSNPIPSEKITSRAKDFTWESCAAKELAIYQKAISHTGENSV
ncbi:MAG: glycosyltransferase [Treponema sp.]|nr:glycosyltransferase [Treponema sp.]